MHLIAYVVDLLDLTVVADILGIQIIGIGISGLGIKERDLFHGDIGAIVLLAIVL